MLDKYLLYTKPGMQLLILSALFFMTMLLAPYLIDGLNMALLGMGTEALEGLKEIPHDKITAVKIVNSIAIIIVLLIPSLLFAYLSHPSPMAFLKLNTPSDLLYWHVSFVIIVAIMPGVGLLENLSARIPVNEGMKDLEDKYKNISSAMLAGTTFKDLFMTTFAICLLPAIVEEIFFRGCLQHVLLNNFRKSPFIAIFITATVFSFLHGQMSGFLPRILLGVILGLAYYFSGSLWVSIWIHFVNNFISVFMVFLWNKKYVKFNVMEMQEVPLGIGLFSLLVACGWTYYFYLKKTPYIYPELPPLTEDKNNTDGTGIF